MWSFLNRINLFSWSYQTSKNDYFAGFLIILEKKCRIFAREI